MSSPAVQNAPQRAAVNADARLWHAGWSVSLAACGAAIVAVFGAMSLPVAGSLILGAAPGLLGYLWRAQGDRRHGLLAAWAVAMAGAAVISGGATGPLAAWCVAPLLAGVLMGATTPGLVFAAGAIIAAALLEWAGVAPSPPSGAEGVALTAVGFVIAFGSVAGALFLVLRQNTLRDQAREAERAWFEEALSAMPHLGAAVDGTGVPEAVFGSAPEGLDTALLAEGLVETALPADRALVAAVLCEALDHGSGETVYRPFGRPDVQLRLAVSRRGENGLSVLLAAAEPPAPAASPAASPAAGDKAELESLKTRLAEAEAARHRAESSAAAKSRFLANMSHELRTPLNAVMGFSDMMRARMFGPMAPKYGEYAELIHESGRHLLDLINDVLDMSKIEADRYTLERESFDARDAINGALRLMRLQADEAGVLLRALTPSAPVMVLADKRAIKQIVLNLVSNAVKFTPPGGSVTVSAEARDEVLEIVVSDTGPGIASEDLQRLGRPFEQAGDAGQRAQGTGLGLSLVKALAGLHGGIMHIESAVGEGAAFTVRLPVIHSAPELPFNEPVKAVETEAVPPDAEPPPVIALHEDAVEDSAADAEGPAWKPGWPAPGPSRGGTVIPLPLSRS